MPLTAKVVVDEAGADESRLDQLAGYLRDDLAEQPPLDVRRAASQSPAPEGARGVDAALVGTLAVTLSQSGALPLLVNLVRGWLQRSPAPGRSVRLQIGDDVLELSAPTRQDTERLVDAFLARHA